MAGLTMRLEGIAPVAAALAWRLRFRYLRARTELAATPRTTWPRTLRRSNGGRPRLAIVVVNFNTARLISQLLFSLYRILGRSEFAIVVVVDNGSTDGSREILESLAEARLIHLIANTEQQYHGPALTKGISWLAERQGSADPTDQIQYVWTLDSDVVVLRRDTACDAVGAFEATGAAAVGQIQDNPLTKRAVRNNPAMLSPFSLILDPVQIWQPSIPPFLEDGAPASGMQVVADADGLRLVPFPFVERGYLIHLGRGTLKTIAESRDTTNRYYEWAIGHNEPYYMGQEGALSAYQRFCEGFDDEVGALTPERITAACSESDLLSLE
jgi:glycosyltransferase involved in cell wall biosynthesis